MSKRKDVDRSWWWDPDDENRTENALNRAWELGRIAGIREAAGMAEYRYLIGRSLRAYARKLKRRLETT